MAPIRWYKSKLWGIRASFSSAKWSLNTDGVVRLAFLYRHRHLTTFHWQGVFLSFLPVSLEPCVEYMEPGSESGPSMFSFIWIVKCSQARAEHFQLPDTCAAPQLPPHLPARFSPGLRLCFRGVLGVIFPKYQFVPERFFPQRCELITSVWDKIGTVFLKRSPDESKTH